MDALEGAESACDLAADGPRPRQIQGIRLRIQEKDTGEGGAREALKDSAEGKPDICTEILRPDQPEGETVAEEGADGEGVRAAVRGARVPALR